MDWWRSSWTQFFCFVFLLVDSKLYSRKSLYGYQYWTCRPEKPHNWQTSLHWTSLDLQFFTSMASLLFFSIYHNLPLPVVAVCPKINCSKISPCWLKKNTWAATVARRCWASMLAPGTAAFRIIRRWCLGGHLEENTRTIRHLRSGMILQVRVISGISGISWYTYYGWMKI